MKNNHLLIVTGNMGSGGLERITASVANEYVSRGWSVRIITLLDIQQNVFVNLHDGVELSFFDDFSSKKFPSKLGKTLLIRKWIKFIQKESNSFEPQCILCMTLKICALTTIACKKTKTRIVMREISDPKSIERSQIENKICFRICRNVDGLIFQTNWEMSCYPKALQKKGTVIVNPVNVGFAGENKEKLIVTMGRLCLSQKSQGILLEAFHLFLDQKPGYRLEIYGDGPDRDKILKMVKENNLQGSVFMMGALKDVLDRIKNAEMFVLTSEYEGLSNALLEAMLMGIPCISSDWHGVEDVIHDGENGLVFHRGDANQLAKGMVKLSNDSVLRQKISAKGVELRDSFSFEHVFPLYRKVIEGDCFTNEEI